MVTESFAICRNQIKRRRFGVQKGVLYIAAIALESKLNKVRIPERLVRIIARTRLKFSFKVEISKRGKADHSALRCCLHH